MVRGDVAKRGLCARRTDMKRALTIAIVALTVACRMTGKDAHDELLKLENDFAQAVVANDAERISKFLADDWVIIDPDGAYDPRLINDRLLLGLNRPETQSTSHSTFYGTTNLGTVLVF